MGAGYHLITNNEWMTIARNIEANGDNWSSGTMGNGGIYRGITAGSSTTAATNLDCTTADSTGGHPRLSSYAAQPLSVDTSKFGSVKSTCDDKRQLKLSNGQVIWDLSGNLWEHVNRSNNSLAETASDIQGNGNLCNATNYWHLNSDPFTTCGTSFGPKTQPSGTNQ